MTWKGIRGTLRWMVLLLLIGVIAAGVVAARWWSAKDQILSQFIQEKLEQTLPECEISFEATRFIDAGHFEVAQLQIRSRITHSEILRIPRMVIAFDINTLRTHRRLAVQEVMIQSPEAQLIRSQDHRWNFEGLRIEPPPSTISPTWTIQNGTLRVGCLSEIDGEMRTVTLQGVQASFRPESFQRYQLEGQGVAETLGPVHVFGVADARTGEWDLQGTAGEISINDALIDLAGRFTPQVQEHIVRLRATNQSLQARSQGQVPVRTASSGIAGSPRREDADVTLMRADVALNFRIGQVARGARLNFEIDGKIENGHVSQALLPLPLYDLEGEFRWTPNSLAIRNLSAANGTSTLYVDGTAQLVQDQWTKNFQVRATQLQLDERIRSFLWGALAKTFDIIQPSGTFDLDVKLSQQPGHPLKWAINRFVAINCQVMCDYFRYPVHDINGHVTQTGETFHLEMTGQANDHPVTLRGQITARPQEPEVALQLTLEDFPFDQSVHNAFQRPEQLGIRKTLEALKLYGTLNSATVDIIRGAQTDGKFLVGVRGEIVDGTMNYTGFPYEVNNLRGRFLFDPLKRNTWYFDNVTGSHGPAKLSARGNYDLEGTSGKLTLELSVLQAALDHDLQRASTTAVPSLSTVWDDFAIKGTIDVDKVSLNWSPDGQCDVALDGIHWSHGQFTPAALPYTWNNVTGTLHWNENRLRIVSLQGDHNGTYLLINGSVPDSAFIDILPSETVAWNMHLDERILHIIKLNPDDELRRAIPTFIADALNAVELQGSVDLSLGLDMKGWLHDLELVTASWSALTALKENRLTAGVPITQVTGNIVNRGSWDGKHLWMEGYGELETLRTLDLNLRNIRGPFQVKNNRLTLGTPQLSDNEPVHNPSNPYRQEQLRADLYGGQVSLDLDVALNGPADMLPYQLEINVSDAELGDWAREHQLNSQRLMGKVNGILQATGRGADAMATTGQGWIQITPAALYELPLFAQLFAALSFRPTQPGDAAFKYAYGDFTIQNGVYDFSKIELWGDAISLVGRGSVGYAGSKANALELDFYSTTNNRIPLLRAFSDRWIRVQVFGTVSQPVARIQPRIPYLNDAFSGFMQALESGRPPQRPLQPSARNPSSGQQNRPR